MTRTRKPIVKSFRVEYKWTDVNGRNHTSNIYRHTASEVRDYVDRSHNGFKGIRVYFQGNDVTASVLLP